MLGHFVLHSLARPPRRWSLAAATLVLPALVACSSARYSVDPGAPTLVVPAHFAAGKKGAEPAPTGSARTPAPESPSSAATAAQASAGSASAPVPPIVAPSTLPDPAPLRMAEQVEYELELKDGKVSVVSVTPIRLPQPIVTPRRIGRYAIELSIGHELIERVRFDFPGTAADEPELGSKKKLYAPLTLGEHAIAHVKLLVPQSPRVRRAALIDRAASSATELAWPLPAVPAKASVKP